MALLVQSHAHLAVVFLARYLGNRAAAEDVLRDRLPHSAHGERNRPR